MSTELSTSMSDLSTELPTNTKRGKIVKLIVIKTKEGMEHKICFVVSKNRKYGSVNQVIRQIKSAERAKLSPYAQSLFDSCFKGW